MIRKILSYVLPGRYSLKRQSPKYVAEPIKRELTAEEQKRDYQEKMRVAWPQMSLKQQATVVTENYLIAKRFGNESYAAVEESLGQTRGMANIYMSALMLHGTSKEDESLVEKVCSLEKEERETLHSEMVSIISKCLAARLGLWDTLEGRVGKESEAGKAAPEKAYHEGSAEKTYGRKEERKAKRSSPHVTYAPAYEQHEYVAHIIDLYRTSPLSVRQIARQVSKEYEVSVTAGDVRKLCHRALGVSHRPSHKSRKRQRGKKRGKRRKR